MLRRGAGSRDASAPPEPKPPLPLPQLFMLSHMEEDGPVRLDGVKLAVCELMGQELDEPKIGAFAGALNALDFPVQLLVRQHPSRPGRAGGDSQGGRAGRPAAADQGSGGSRSDACMGEMESRDGVLDRRFYAVCDHRQAEDLHGLLDPGRALRASAQSAASFACSSQQLHPGRLAEGD